LRFLSCRALWQRTNKSTARRNARMQRLKRREEATIAELMGHSDPKTTRRYTHGTERAKRAAIEATSLRGADGVGRRAELALVAG
jgi:integrase